MSAEPRGHLACRSQLCLHVSGSSIDHNCSTGMGILHCGRTCRPQEPVPPAYSAATPTPQLPCQGRRAVSNIYVMMPADHMSAAKLYFFLSTSGAAYTGEPAPHIDRACQQGVAHRGCKCESQRCESIAPAATHPHVHSERPQARSAQLCQSPQPSAASPGLCLRI